MTIKPGDRVHCDKWLAHRPGGWKVTDVWEPIGRVRLIAGTTTLAHVPLADCTLVPRPFKVGDWVRRMLDDRRGPGLVFAVTETETLVWVGFGDGYADGYRPDQLTHIDPPEQSHA